MEKDPSNLASVLHAPRLSRVRADAAIVLVAAALVASCVPHSIFGFELRPDPQRSATHVVGEAIAAGMSGFAHRAAVISASDRAPPAQAASSLPQGAEAVGVGFKRGSPLAEVRQQLAQLLRSGTIDAVSDGNMEDATSGIFVQIGSHQLRSAAEAHLGAAKLSLGSVVAGFDFRLRPAMLPAQGQFFRVQIGPIASQGAALDLCRALQARQQACFLVAEQAVAPAKPSGQIAFRGDWASIGRDERAERRPASATAPQFADAFPVYTMPTLPGLPEREGGHDAIGYAGVSATTM
jgi:hypothetical protein